MTVGCRWMEPRQVHYYSDCCSQISSAADRSPVVVGIALRPRYRLEAGVQRMAQTVLGFVGRSNLDLQVKDK